MKMKQLFTAHYSDGRTEHERPLAWIYKNQNGAGVTITPTIWLWGHGKTYNVDYVGRSYGCTLGAFNGSGALSRAKEFAKQCGDMEQAAFAAWLRH